jgi:hypothetical protein
MNDDELITAVRDSFTGVRSATPAERIISRSRAVRARRRVPCVAAAIGTAAAAAAAVTVALSPTPPAAGHPAASHPASGPAAKLAAWTVARQADGSIRVTIRELRDAAGLQRVLRADGVPASVTFPGPENPACRNLPMPHPRWRPGLTHAQLSGGPVYPGPPPYALVIRPAALPPGAGVTLFYPTAAQIRTFHHYHQYPGSPLTPSVGLVHASPQCTGS